MEELSNMFLEISRYYAIKKDKYRSRTYSLASKIVSEKNYSPEEIEKVKNIGPSVAADLSEYLSTGTITRLETLRKEFPDTLDFTDYYGIGPSHIQEYEKKGIKNLKDLWFSEIPENIRLGILWHDHISKKIPRSDMLEIEKLFKKLFKKGFEITGSFRRKEPFSSDIDVIFFDIPMEAILEKLNPYLIGTLARGDQSYQGIIFYPDQAHRIDIKTFQKENYPFALLHFTGPKMFNINLRREALKQGYNLTEYGFKKNGKYIPQNFKTEKEIMEFLGLEYVSPENRS